ncbi:MAG: response regulator [Sulfuricurvum sp.]|jgi:two-component system chemotaxis response regulator CheY|uniref:response regulator n=1 Tax=Sulfuricurvum sp. TaxID=2025608 RepID=UPI0025D218F7|nr:response regulator [Sulfuricurvum sp.]MCK9371844.1 response regulator [Sulfuricurvum sp.]
MATVMVVDDSKTVRSYHGSILREFGIEVLEAENGMEALEKTLDNTIDLYLVDVNMPVMDGYSFVSELRRQPLHQRTPVIMITTQEEQTDKIEAFRVGANLFETKPIKPDALKGYLQLLLNIRVKGNA